MRRARNREVEGSLNEASREQVPVRGAAANSAVESGSGGDSATSPMNNG